MQQVRVCSRAARPMHAAYTLACAAAARAAPANSPSSAAAAHSAASRATSPASIGTRTPLRSGGGWGSGPRRYTQQPQHTTLHQSAWSGKGRQVCWGVQTSSAAWSSGILARKLRAEAEYCSRHCAAETGVRARARLASTAFEQLGRGQPCDVSDVVCVMLHLSCLCSRRHLCCVPASKMR